MDMDYTDNLHDHEEPETAGRSSSRSAINIKALRAVFRRMEDSKDRVVSGIQRLNRTSEEALREKENTDNRLEEALEQLADARQKIRELEGELSTLKREFGTAAELLNKLDETIG